MSRLHDERSVRKRYELKFKSKQISRQENGYVLKFMASGLVEERGTVPCIVVANNTNPFTETTTFRALRSDLGAHVIKLIKKIT